MTTTTPARPVPQLPKPELVWERHRLFQEPVYADGWALEDDDTDEQAA